MQIANPGPKIIIVGASSPQFEMVEIHRTEIVDGMARMIPQDRLPVPAGGSVTLEPGGLHLMLIQAKQPLQAAIMSRSICGSTTAPARRSMPKSVPAWPKAWITVSSCTTDLRENEPHNDRPGLGDYLRAWPQYLLPHHALSRLVLAATRAKRAGGNNC